MAWSASTSSLPLLCAACIFLIFSAKPAHAFGAGNIASTSKIEGQNWRHGDIEDTLLTIMISRAAGGKKFSKLDVKRVYFGNWLRDYSQAIDVGTVKYVSAEAIRLLLWVLGFMSFGYGTKEFEVTTERLGCYRPEEHIDNPKDYADNEDARQYDRRLRGPVDERKELAIDPQTGMKNYIASEHLGIVTSAGLVRRLFGRSIQLGRQYARSKNPGDLYEALRLLGTGCHCLEDYSAHSNYTELALIELGERGIFPHVGRRTQVELRGVRHPVYPIITGTFGGVDFLHSVMGEFDDKATQSELQELEGVMVQSQGSQDSSIIQNLLNQVPSGILGGTDQAGKADELQSNAQAHQMQNTHISPRQPEEWAKYVEDAQKQIYPILEWHDEIMKSITEAIEEIPILPALIEQIQDQINMFVFSLLAPFVVPIINQVKTELNTGSSEIIQSSIAKQHIVFRDDRSSDPTHSMLSKDHFSNVLNEPAGKVSSEVLKWVVPQLIACWDNERIDVDRTLNRIITGVLHHPALRDHGQDGASDGRKLMFGVVEQWWRSKDEQERSDLRQQLSREGVESGKNHKPGEHDSGHGCGKPLGMTSLSGSSGQMSSSSAVSAAMGALYGGGSGGGGGHSGSGPSSQIGKFAGEAVGGGILGGLVGGVIGSVGENLLSGFGNSEKKTYEHHGYGQDGSFNETFTQIGEGHGRYGQAEYTQTEEVGGGRRQEYRRYDQSEQSAFGLDEVIETKPTYGGGFERTSEIRRTHGGGVWDSEVTHEQRSSMGEYRSETQHSSGADGGKDEGEDEDEEHEEHKKKKHHEKEHEKQHEKKHEKQQHEKQQHEKQQHEKKHRGKKHSQDDNEPPRYGGNNRPEESSDEPRGQYGRSEFGQESGGFGGESGFGREEPFEGRFSGGGGGGYGAEFGSGRSRREEDSERYGGIGGGNDYRQDFSSTGGFEQGDYTSGTAGRFGGGDNYGRQSERRYEQVESDTGRSDRFGGGGRQFGGEPEPEQEQEQFSYGGSGFGGIAEDRFGGGGRRREDDNEGGGGLFGSGGLFGGGGGGGGRRQDEEEPQYGGSGGEDEYGEQRRQGYGGVGSRGGDGGWGPSSG